MTTRGTLFLSLRARARSGASSRATTSAAREGRDLGDEGGAWFRARAEAARDGALATARDRAKRKGKFVTTLKWLYGARARTRARTRARHRAASVHARRSNTSSTS